MWAENSAGVTPAIAAETERAVAVGACLPGAATVNAILKSESAFLAADSTTYGVLVDTSTSTGQVLISADSSDLRLLPIAPSAYHAARKRAISPSVGVSSSSGPWQMLCLGPTHERRSCVSGHNDDIPSRHMPSDQALTSIDELFRAFHSAGSSPDLIHAVVLAGSVIHATGQSSESSTPPTCDSVFRIASMTKSFTAAAALLLRDEGALTLDEPVYNIVPEVASISRTTSDAPELTLRMLLTMSAGFPSDVPWSNRHESLTPEDFSSLLTSGLRHSSTPGTTYEYSNLGYAIVGRAIANVSGTTYQDFVKTRLLDPLSMSSSGFAYEDVDSSRVVTGHRWHQDRWISLEFSRPGAFSAMGGMYTTVNDLARWVGGFTDAFPPRDDSENWHPLQRSTRREMQQLLRFDSAAALWPPAGRVSEHVGGATPASTAVRATGYGMGLTIEEDSRWGRIAGHTGSYPGFGAHMRWHPSSQLAIIALGNATYVATRKPATAALDLLLGDEPTTSSASEPWPQTLAMRSKVHHLILQWDDLLADEIFAPNMDLDTPRGTQRLQLQQLRDQLGYPSPDLTGAFRTSSGSHIAWTMNGRHALAELEIWLTPEAEPKLQRIKFRLREA